MTSNQLLTLGAVAFALYAVSVIAKKPGQGAAVQPGQSLRDIALMDWHDLQTAQQNYFALGQLFSVQSTPLSEYLPGSQA